MLVNSTVVAERATKDNFSEDHYLICNPDVGRAVLDGKMPSGHVHFDRQGHKGPCYMRFPERIPTLRQRKLKNSSLCCSKTWSMCGGVINGIT